MILCGCETFPSPSGPVAITYLCSIHAHNDFMKLLNDVKDVVRFDDTSYSLVWGTVLLTIDLIVGGWGGLLVVTGAVIALVARYV